MGVWRPALVVSLLACAGCNRATQVLVDVEGPPLRSLEARVAVDGLSEQAPVLVPNPSVPGRIVVQLPDAVLRVTVTVTGTPETGPVLVASDTVVSVPNEQVTMRLVLGGGPLPDLNGVDAGPVDLRPPVYTTLELVAGALGGGGALDGTGNGARFFQPHGLAADGAGSLYTADTQTSIIRRINIATGAVTTLAGVVGQTGPTNGVGTAARFAKPRGIVADGAGNLYVADTGNHTIRKIVIATATVSTIAGSPGSSGSTDATGAAARFMRPHGLALDGAGNLFIADTQNSTIRQLVPATGAVTTLAGTAGVVGTTDALGTAARFDHPHYLVFAGGVLYVSDMRSSTIRAIDNTGNVTTLAGGAGIDGNVDAAGLAARFNGPQGLATDGVGNLYVADRQNQLIRKVVIAGAVVTRVAGSVMPSASIDGIGTAARFAIPQGLAFDGTNLWVSERDGQSLRKIVLGTQTVSTPIGRPPSEAKVDGVGAAARFSRPHGMAADGAGNIYIADTKLGVIRKVDTASATVTTVAGKGFSSASDGVGSAAGFRQPTAVALDNMGNLWVADRTNHTIRKIVLATTAVSTPVGLAGTPGTADGTGNVARFDHPMGVAADNLGSVYIADSYNHAIRKLVVATSAVTTIAGRINVAGGTDAVGTNARFDEPIGLAWDGQDTLYISERSPNRVRRMSLSTLAVTTLVPASAGLQEPHGLAYDPRGLLYIGDTTNHLVRRVSLDTGMMTTLAGTNGRSEVVLGALPGGLNAPSGVVVGSDGALYVTVARENSLLRIK